MFVLSCESGNQKQSILKGIRKEVSIPVLTPIDKGFSEFITAYTSGTIASNSQIEIHFTPAFAEKANKNVSGLFEFDPAIKGTTSWKDPNTLVFTPSRLLEPATIYTGSLNIGKIASVDERLKIFPLRIQTVKKDFRVSVSPLQSTGEGKSYALIGRLQVSDYAEAGEVENYLTVKIDRKKADIKWDHSANPVHTFTIEGIDRDKDSRDLTLSWDGSQWGASQKGAATVNIPAEGEFKVIDVSKQPGDNQRIDVVFSDPIDAAQDLTGLIELKPSREFTTSVSSNLISIFPSVPLNGKTTLNIESSVRNIKGKNLNAPIGQELDFTPVPPSIVLEGNGVIIPASKDLIFPFKAANLKAVDLRIIKIYDNNLPYFLQENDLNGSGSVKRFGRPLYSGKVDLVNNDQHNGNGWNMYTIDLSDYITVEPGVLYKVELGMRRSYSLYPCSNNSDGISDFEKKLQEFEEENKDFWDNPESFYDSDQDNLYYSFGFDWDDRSDPCKDAYYSPDRNVSRNVLATNLGIMAKKGEGNTMHVNVNDILTAQPLNEVSIEVYSLQMQLLATAMTNQEGVASFDCKGKPFLLIAKKDKDRSYLKVNDGSALSLSSFDVSGESPEDGIKAFIYGERDVWRPGDSIYLSLFIKDLKKSLPGDHPVVFELINPMEQKIDNQVKKTGGNNLIVFSTTTASDAATGAYRAQFRIGGAIFTKRIRIETVKPNRLKINMSFPAEILGGSKEIVNGSLSAKWLNGSTARNLKANIDYILRHTKTEFEKYKQFDFDDPINQFTSSTVNILDKNTDENGNTAFSFEPGKDINAPGMLNAVFTARVAEPGGDESIIQTTYKYAPFPVFAGINIPGLKGKSRTLFTDAENEVKFVTVDEYGKPVNSELEVSIYKISYRWWWESDHEDLAYYISNNSYKPVLRKTITTSNGQGNLSFKIDKKDWGRYLIRATTPGGHSTGRILLVDWPWEYGSKGGGEGATLIAVSTDKEKYAPGDDVKLTFPAPENSSAIVTLENSTGVLDEIRVNTDRKNTVVTFRARPDMAPNVYAYVTVIQPHAQSVNDMPVRLYGVVPVIVEDPQTRLTPKITMADEIRSQKPFEVKISEASRKEMTYTLAIVDEGLLDITGFKTPDPWKYFYAREALGVQTWDIYDYVLGAFGGTLGRVLSVGGDEALADRSANKAKRFIPVVKFLGPFNLAAGKTAVHSITLPQYTGSVRVMAIAGNNRAYGTSEKSVVVKDPLMMLVTAPRVLSPGEKVTLPVSLFIQKEGITEITVKAEGNDLVKIGSPSITVPVSGTGEKEASFTLTTAERTGIARIKLTASGGGETAVYDMEIGIRSPNPPEVHSELKILKKGEKYETSISPFGLPGTNSVTVEASGLPSINLEQRLEYLVDYPHGCSEQIVSAAFPQLWLSDLTGNKDITKETSYNISKAITMIASRQMVDGGIALWPGASQPDNWVTSYAGHFLIEAERKGFSVPSGLKDKLISYQSKIAGSWRYDPKFKYTANDQAYRLFMLALAGKSEKGAMNRLRETNGIPLLSRWLLAAAYATSGRPEVASSLLDVRLTDTETEMYNYYYGSEIRDKSIILYTLTLLKNFEQALPLVKYICDNFSTDAWYSTQSVAWGLYSYMKWSGAMQNSQNTFTDIRVTYNGEKSQVKLAPGQIMKKDFMKLKDKNTLVVENLSENPVYANISRKGTPVISDKPREEKGISMKIEYLDLKMNPLDKTNLKQGTDFMMVTRISNNTFAHLTNISLTQMVPSGWEIRNTRMYDADFGIKESQFDYRDYRDDRVNTYFNLGLGQTKVFVVILNAAYRGEYYQPAISCEAMYLPGCYSRYPGGIVKVLGE